MHFRENFRDYNPTLISSLKHNKYIRLTGELTKMVEVLGSSNEQVATASLESIQEFASFPEAMEAIFPENDSDLRNLSARCSSLARVRVCSLIVKLFSASASMAAAVYNSELLSLLEAEVSNKDDTLVTSSILELFYELAEVEHGTVLLGGTPIIQVLSSIISDTSVDRILRSRAMMITGRVLSKENFYAVTDESSVKPLISDIDRLLESEIQDSDECECALEALGKIGSSTTGATLLLSMLPPAARHVIYAAFDRQARGKQLAALAALGDISGQSRSENDIILNDEAEENLRRLIYETASKSSKLTPSGLFLSILQQDSEVRLAAYRVITGLVRRSWCLMEICSKQEIVNIVTDPNKETVKRGMDARYDCCKAIHKAFMASGKLSSNPALTGIASMLQEAVSRGAYFTGQHRVAQPTVKTAERF
ncbi:uncharacterized protein LOC126669186 isoform X2 [Mercurialis annua]|uniref:uncharacterized protein LOC126669186 isoform X2 n=1 Tax=Mercurialis annua TaxID=3986 RepID=UPI00216022FD|nr:uncharacterized protein LOC126669186 isoform X2 [Mercurialis annua]